MSDWITDRRPTIVDSDMSGFVWVTTEYGTVLTQHWAQVYDRPWMPIPKIVPPEPYVKPKRWRVSSAEFGDYVIYDAKFCVYMAPPLPTREAAERIAAIYEEVMP